MLFVLEALSVWSSAPNTGAKAVDAAKSMTGSEACAGCHSEIYKSYSKTVMANASGVARDGLMTGDFVHKPSGVRYRVYEQDEHAWMSYERDSESGFRGQRELLYFIGSGVKGRTYLFSVDEFFSRPPSTGTRRKADGTWRRHIRRPRGVR